MISGEFIRLRPFERADLEACREWVNNPDIAKDILRVLPVTMSEHLKWYETIIEDKTRVTFAIESVQERKYVGNTGLMNLDWRNRKAALWIYLAKEAWGRGYGRESVYLLQKFAFESLNLHKVYLDVASFNERAINTYRGLGFKEDGRLRDDVYIGGTYYDVFRMSKLSSEPAEK